MKVSFITSANDKSGWPLEGLPEVVVVGKSNVGKSSFINAFTNRKKLAYVGNTPGKTRLINFFNVDDVYHLVDVPGYGYAKMSKTMLVHMGKMMDEYFTQRQTIRLVIQLIDGRHGPTEDDWDMIEYLDSLKMPLLMVATKFDKVPKSKRLHQLKQLTTALQQEVFAVSNTDRTGFEQIEEQIKKAIR